MKAPRQSKEITELVNYYVQHRNEEPVHIREALEYFWGCMNDATIEDYLESIKQGE